MSSTMTLPVSVSMTWTSTSSAWVPFWKTTSPRRRAWKSALIVWLPRVSYAPLLSPAASLTSTTASMVSLSSDWNRDVSARTKTLSTPVTFSPTVLV